MVGGVNSAEGYQYFLQLKKAQGTGTRASWFFNGVDTNGNGSTSGSGFSVFQSSLMGGTQGGQSSSQSDSTEFLVNLLQNLGQINSTNTSTGAVGSSPSQQSTIGQTSNQMDTIGNGVISNNGPAAYQSSEDALLQSDILSEASASTATQSSDMTNMTSLIQQAISKYLQLSPAGLVGTAALDGIVAAQQT